VKNGTGLQTQPDDPNPQDGIRGESPAPLLELNDNFSLNSK